jgi:MATE family multidrug resistance protein
MTWTQRWHRDGGGRELLRLAFPLIVSNSFWTLQVFTDRVLLGRSSSDAVAAAMPAVVLFWTPLTLLQNIAGYANTFVAQYTGANRPHRVGAVVWQALYVAVAGGLLFMALVPLAGSLVALGGHSPGIQKLEAAYLRCLCYSALPTLIVAAVSSFFSGRGDSWTVLVINATGLVVNAPLAYLWIYGHAGFPALGIEGAGWATVVGSSTSAVLGLALFFRRRYRKTHATASGYCFDAELFGRLLRFGVPNGLVYMMDALAFGAFLFLVGWLGDAELAATSITFSINLVAILPMLGMAQAVEVLVGQRLGQDRPDLAERTTWTGFGLTWLYMVAVALMYALAPELFLTLFRSEEAAKWARVAALVPVLLRFVAVYSLFDSMNLVFSFALRGAGDTRFVTFMVVALSWPLMVLPTWVSWYLGWGLFWAWGFASVYVCVLGLGFLWRFRAGKWKAMRVIEPVPAVG